ncbi:serine protease [Pullulanibacillus camelliae]|uniref:Serine protease n=1 Tax=Pullulanibacillus camelliae TaxID=1707096 RepID=A0A8J2YL92_9BACL|nr:trypsin-like peptidase domain-containing protein [Pullulanibacillus camelliae]GGE52740.1 serine protease [Pullulanibacillus camelliae]
MGYYSNDNDGSNKKPSRSPRYARSGWFISGLLGALVAIVVFFIASPYLAKHNLLPGSNDSSQVSGIPTTDATSNSQNHHTENLTIKNSTDSVESAVDKVSPAVVAVINMQKQSDGTNFLQSDTLQEAGMGSGIIYKKSGQYAYVVTNNHVVSGADKLEVQFDNNTKVTGKLLGEDSLYDLAVIRIPSDKVNKVASFGQSSALKRGEPVIAIGNPLGFSGSVTQGIVSSNNRMIERTVDTQGGQVQYNAQVIQTDAAINPGNSGGALVNIQGQVVGINSLKIAETDTEGIGFAIPIDVAIPVINQLEKTGKVERPYMGIGLVDLSEVAGNIQQLNLPKTVTSGLVVSQISSNSPAGKAGLKEGDVIVAVNSQKIKDYVDFSTYLYTKLKVGQTVKIDYYRNGDKKTTSLTLGGKTFS